jgi:NAD(P)-dependent dehydrogenase (short-subunit alcohol dehydrogenase family)
LQSAAWQAAARDLGRYGIRVNSGHPVVVPTELAKNLPVMQNLSSRRDLIDGLTTEVPSASAQVCDVTSNTEARVLVDGVIRRHGHIDVLVNDGWAARTGRRVQPQRYY